MGLLLVTNLNFPGRKTTDQQLNVRSDLELGYNLWLISQQFKPHQESCWVGVFVAGDFIMVCYVGFCLYPSQRRNPPMHMCTGASSSVLSFTRFIQFAYWWRIPACRRNKTFLFRPPPCKCVLGEVSRCPSQARGELRRTAWNNVSSFHWLGRRTQPVTVMLSGVDSGPSGMKTR